MIHRNIALVIYIDHKYIHASFLRRNPQHAECGHGRQYAGAAISFTQSDASDVTSATASLRSVRPATFFI
jgi:hypothetical protein